MSQCGVDASIKQAYFIAVEGIEKEKHKKNWSIKYFQNNKIDGYRMESTWVAGC